MPAAPCPLNERERQLLSLLAEGLTHESIAKRLGVAESWVGSRLRKQIYPRLGVRNGYAAIAVMFRQGWMDPDEDEDFPLPSPALAEHLNLARPDLWWLKDPDQAALDDLLRDVGDADPRLPQNALAERLARNKVAR